MSLKYSVIVPIYKVIDYIDECVQSIINQTYDNIEIILVDDGSPDKCGEKCDHYAKNDTRIKVVHKQNGGLVSARKSGAAVATGDYICCVDGDDYISLTYIEEMNKIIEKTSPDIVCCNYAIVDNGEIIKTKGKIPLGLYDRKRMEMQIFPLLIQSEDGNYFPPTVWAKAIKKEIYIPSQMKVVDEISIGEDGACTIPCFYHSNSVYIMEQNLYFYRYNRASMTKVKKCLNWEGQILIAELLYNSIDTSLFDFRDQMYRRIVKGFFTVAKSRFNSNKTYGQVRKEILSAMKKPVFGEAILNCKYRHSLKMKYIQIALRYKMIGLLWIANRM